MHQDREREGGALTEDSEKKARGNRTRNERDANCLFLTIHKRETNARISLNDISAPKRDWGSISLSVITKGGPFVNLNKSHTHTTIHHGRTRIHREMESLTGRAQMSRCPFAKKQKKKKVCDCIIQRPD